MDVSPRPMKFIMLSIALSLISSLAAAQQPRVGAMAPTIELDQWIQLAPGDTPTPESLKGRAILVEFWGTWCAPCVQSMPHVQDLHDRYAELGLVVLAISYEPLTTVDPFVRKNGYTYAFGCDPSMELVTAFGVGGWPTTFLIDERGRIAYVGTPRSVEPAIERVLGLPADAAGSLNAHVRAVAVGDRAAVRSSLERLIERRPRAFDISRWARIAPGGPPAASGGEARVTEASEGLDEYLRATAAGEKEARARTLANLAACDAHEFDLLGWARAGYRAAWPVTAKKLEQLLKGKRYAQATEALLHRAPDPASVELAISDSGFAEYCTRGAPDARSHAKKGLMIEHWIFAGIEPRNSQKFWADLGVGGLQRLGDGRVLREVHLGSESLTPASVSSYIDEQLHLSLAMSSLASHRAPPSSSGSKRIRAQRALLLESMLSKYGERAVDRSRATGGGQH